MRSAVAASIVPVGWPPLAEAMAKTLEHKVPVHVGGPARGPVGSWRATWLSERHVGTPAIFVGLVEWADKVLTE
jgi:hypothetical protein